MVYLRLVTDHGRVFTGAAMVYLRLVTDHGRSLFHH